MNIIQRLARNVIRSCGYDLVVRNKDAVGDDCYWDIKKSLRGNDKPVVIDVGANAGQTIARVLEVAPHARIHSFEPSPSVFAELTTRYGGYSNVDLWNCGCGSRPGSLVLHENEFSEISSFLLPGKVGWGSVTKSVEVPVVSLDEWAERNQIGAVDILKSDTQGFDLEVLKGAERLFSQGRIRIVLCEVNFLPLYAGMGRFEDLYSFLVDHKFAMVSLYKPKYHNGLMRDADILFVRNEEGI